MSLYHAHLNTAKKILSEYDGEEPFALFLKKYFSRYKKYGSKDRKQVGHLCYCYFRLGKALQNIPVEEKIIVGLFLCLTKSEEMLNALRPEWNEKSSLSIEEKLSFIKFPLSLESVFPWKEELNEGIDRERFCESFFQQPDLFLRLRPGKEEWVKEKLCKAGIDFILVNDSCISINNSSKIDTIIEIDKEAVVQDYNSQQTGEIIKSYIQNLKSKNTIWDCCAGSGGKSIMLYDCYHGNMDITVSDIRESILINLKRRFARAGINNFQSHILDLSKENLQSSIFNKKYSIVLADVPCTGSGTWGRTPEQLFYFKKEKISEYAALQKKIISNVIPHIKAGGYLVYITCSVFGKENEEMIELIETRIPSSINQYG